MSSLDSFEGITTLDPPPRPGPLHRLPGGALIDAVYPGLLVAATIALASTWLSQHYGAPVMLFGLLFGMAFHFLHEDGRCVAGIEFASRSSAVGCRAAGRADHRSADHRAWAWCRC